MRKRSQTRKPSDRSNKHAVHRHDPAHPKRGRTDFERLRRTTDAEIDQQIAADPDTAPAIDESWMADAERVESKTKRGVFIRLDPEVLDYFKRGGPKYQTRMNAVLLAYVRAQQERRPSVSAQDAEDLRRAAEFGVDISLLRASLAMTPLERLRANDEALAFFSAVSVTPGTAGTSEARAR